MAYLLFSAVGSYTWTMVKCNQQEVDSNAGYYVMRWMYDFVITHQIHFPKTIPWTSRHQLIEKDIDRTVEQWHMMCPI
nr:ulp1 protease family, C-terminal catalytic domain-containing protein [Tanacetum cinerariifolium]